MGEQSQDFKWVGKRTLRPDGPDKVTGRAKFGADLRLPGMLHGRVLRSPHAHAVIRSIDTSKAKALPGVKCLPSDGTFYSFPDFSEAISRLDLADDLAFAEFLINEAGVALVPGSAFGAPGHGRISFATSQANLDKAVDRIAGVLPG